MSSITTVWVCLSLYGAGRWIGVLKDLVGKGDEGEKGWKREKRGKAKNPN